MKLSYFARRPINGSSLAADLLLQWQDIGEKSQPKGGNKCAGEENAHPKRRRPWIGFHRGLKCSGDWPGASSTSIAGFPWSGLVPLVVCGYLGDRNRSSCQVSSCWRLPIVVNVLQC